MSLDNTECTSSSSKTHCYHNSRHEEGLLNWILTLGGLFSSHLFTYKCCWCKKITCVNCEEEARQCRRKP